jgi:HAD superfamily hydrolase (TIGR01549 family)
MAQPAAAFIFDLDGTLVDNVYQHALAWHAALIGANLPLSVWKLHRRIGMSGGLLLHALRRELGNELNNGLIEELKKAHEREFLARTGDTTLLPGAQELLDVLTREKIPWAIASSGSGRTYRAAIDLLELPPGTTVVTRDDVAFAKPNPDLFREAAKRLGIDPSTAFVVGDTVWDMLAAQRFGALGVGLLSGGYGSSELQGSGAYQIYDDPADLHAHLDEFGIRV